MEQMLLAYSLPREAFAAKMMLYKNTKVKVHSPDGDTNFFDIVTGGLKVEAYTPYLYFIVINQ